MLSDRAGELRREEGVAGALISLMRDPGGRRRDSEGGCGDHRLGLELRGSIERTKPGNSRW